ncbi:MAG TPA: ATP-dependent DNA ligase [Acidimicrobiales bacterium]|nr:ATP-dependent DNA ligase [Acidimicrobiales bacterium]
MRFADVVATTGEVTATRARSRKVAALADLFARLGPDEVPVVVAILTGTPRQGRIGIGWRTVAAIEEPPATEPQLEIADVDDALERIDALRGTGSQAARTAALRSLLARATEAEQDLLRRLLVGELRHGALEGLVTDALAKAAGVPLPTMRRAAMLAGDLPSVANIALTEGEAGLDAIGLTLLRPILPMLAQTAADVTEALALTASPNDGVRADNGGEARGGGEARDSSDSDGGEAGEGGGPAGEASVEWKLDGARIQLHRVGDEVRIYTRNLNDVTARLPGIVDLARSLPAHSFVLDGEAIGVGEDELPQVFQDTMSQFGRQADGAGAGLASRFFDILHLDGDDLIDRPLRARLATLERLAGRWRIPGVITADPAEAQRVLDEALAAGHEGVMVKSASSPYEAGRRGGAWRKVKPVHTLDLVVLAAEWGSGRRRGWLSNLHLGARDPDNPGEYVMVGKTFKGLTDELLTWQTERFPELETHRTDYAVFIRPELVVEIALDGVQSSTRYAGGVALRFARVKRYRPDKSPAEADTIDAVRAMLPGRKVQSLPDG